MRIVCKGTRDKQCGGTNAGFRHGPDTCITRKNIKRLQAEHARRSAEPLNANQVVLRLVTFPEPRHFVRAALLM